MNKHSIAIFSIMAAAALSLTGCASTKAAETDKIPPPEFLQEQDRFQMQTQAMKQGNMMLQAVKDKNYAGFTQFFPDEVKKKFTPKAFAQFDTYIGQLEKWEYLTDMVSPITTAFLWKTTVRRKDAKGKEITVNLLFQLALAKQNGKYVVVGSWFR